MEVNSCDPASFDIDFFPTEEKKASGDVDETPVRLSKRGKIYTPSNAAINSDAVWKRSAGFFAIAC